jgi:hypothetical protein
MGLRRVIMAKTFSLEDLIEYEVNKRVGEKEEGGGDFDLGRLMKLLKMLIKLREMELKATTAIKPQAQPKPQPQPQPTKLNPDDVINSVLQLINFIITNYGDIPLSEVKKLMEQKREVIKGLIAQKLEGGK